MWDIIAIQVLHGVKSLKWKSQGTSHHLLNIYVGNYKKTTGGGIWCPLPTEIGLMNTRMREGNYQWYISDQASIYNLLIFSSVEDGEDDDDKRWMNATFPSGVDAASFAMQLKTTWVKIR